MTNPIAAVLPIRILGTGQALPSRVVPTAEVAALCGLTAEAAEARTGVRERRWLSGSETALTLGAQAARGALAAANLALEDVDVLLNASGTQAQPIPDGGALLARELGLSGRAAYSIHGTCLSFLLALQHAALLIGSGQAARVLIVSTEGGSVGLNMAQPKVPFLIGDGAAAVVLGRAVRPGQGLHAARIKPIPRARITPAFRAAAPCAIPATPPCSPRNTCSICRASGVLKLASRVVPASLERLRPGLSTGLQAFPAWCRIRPARWGWICCAATEARRPGRSHPAHARKRDRREPAPHAASGAEYRAGRGGRHRVDGGHRAGLTAGG